MKNYIKKGLGFVLFAATFCLTLVYLSGSVKALTSPPPVNASNFKFIDGANISGTINGQSATFFDKDIHDGIYNYAPQNIDGNTFCDPHKGYWGINFAKGTDFGAKSLSGTLNLGYRYQQGNVKECRPIGDISVSVDNSHSLAGISYKWQIPNIVSVNGNETFQPAPGTNSIFINQAGNGTCEASGIIITDSPNSGTKYNLIGINRGGQPGGPVPDILGIYLRIPDACRLLSTEKITITGQAPDNVGSGDHTGEPCVQGQPTPPGYECSGNCTDSGSHIECTLVPTNTTPPPGGIDNTGKTCEDLSVGQPLSWLICPVLTAANALANTLTAAFEEQLSFTISETGKNPAHNHPTITDSGRNQLKNVWSLIRDITSALLVIILLVAIISEAVGGGPFDAYAVRKVLPKVVVAAILIQLSWFFFIWIINAVDDIGRGLADLLFAPFGGAQSMSLGSLMAQAGIGTGAGAAFSWIGLIGVIIGIIVAPFIILLFCMTAITAIFTGLLVLIFRKVLIIMALILSPIALVLWILPGTQRYFKLWQDNFGKALFMFPLAVAIIAAGRIFAYVVSYQNTGTLINFLLVMVGFFGPLFILPKTFKWGGQIMQLAGNSAFQARTKMHERPNKFLRGRQEGLTAIRREKAAQREWQRERGFQLHGIERALNPLDKFRSGKWDPTLGPRLRQNTLWRRRQFGQFIGKARQATAESIDDYDKLITARTEEMNKEQKQVALKNMFDKSNVYEEQMAIMRQLAKWEGGHQLTAIRNKLYEDYKAGGPGAEKKARLWNDAASSFATEFKAVSPHLNQGFEGAYETEKNPDGSIRIDAEGNPVYKLDAEGNKIVTKDENGRIIYNIPFIDQQPTEAPDWQRLTNQEKQQRYEAAFNEMDQKRFRTRPRGDTAVMTDSGWQRLAAVDRDRARNLYFELRQNPTLSGSLAGQADAIFGADYEDWVAQQTPQAQPPPQPPPHRRQP